MNEVINMELVNAKSEHLETLIGWFPDLAQAREWSGPNIRFPMSVQSLQEDTQMDQLASRALLAGHGELIGFGQFYARRAHCHLGRLAISPSARGQRHGETLIRLLAQTAEHTLGYQQCSLFVLEHNLAARKLYERMGFSYQTYPDDDITLPGCLYMTLDRIPS